MQISIVVAAHNEAARIGDCLASLAQQTRRADEIIVVAHNCTDATAPIARTFPGVRVLELTGPAGVPYAREHGFRAASGDIIASIDGDSQADPHWLEAITEPLTHQSVVMSGGLVWLTGSFTGWMKSLYFFFLRPLIVPHRPFYVWGANFAVRRAAFQQVNGFRPLIDRWYQALQLTEWAEDVYLSYALRSRGSLRFVRQAVVRSPSRKESPLAMLATSQRQRADERQLLKALRSDQT